MDKYGVVQEATEDKVCRQCGRPLADRTETNAVLCPKCGTKPYEDCSVKYEAT
jgi:predicted RNA-binding Zn-ribbon protein involved in translation (DUF1610 family)